MAIREPSLCFVLTCHAIGEPRQSNLIIKVRKKEISVSLKVTLFVLRHLVNKEI